MQLTVGGICCSMCLQSLAVLLKALGGAVPWHTYTNLLEKSYKTAKDHATAIDTATFIQQVVSGVSALCTESRTPVARSTCLVASTCRACACAFNFTLSVFLPQREVLAVEAAAAGVLEALLAATAAHKSAAAVRAGASCLLALCQTAPELREKLGQLPGVCYCLLGSTFVLNPQGSGTAQGNPSSILLLGL